MPIFCNVADKIVAYSFIMYSVHTRHSQHIREIYYVLLVLREHRSMGAILPVSEQRCSCSRSCSRPSRTSAPTLPRLLLLLPVLLLLSVMSFYLLLVLQLQLLMLQVQLPVFQVQLPMLSKLSLILSTVSNYRQSMLANYKPTWLVLFLAKD